MKKVKTTNQFFYLGGSYAQIRHDQKLRFSKSASHIEIYYSRLTPVISHLLIINTLLPTR
jgi:hypothetical protein